METVGMIEAKTHLTRLVQRVANGERIVITIRGKPVAVLIPPEVERTKDSAQIGRTMLEYRDHVKRRLASSFRDLAHGRHRH
jgi:prevent-host-death family protein